MSYSVRYTTQSRDFGIIEIDGVEWRTPLPPEIPSMRERYEQWLAEGNVPDDAFQEPPPAPMPDLSDRQFFQGLAEWGIITWEEAEAAVGPGEIPAELLGYLDAIADERERARARVKIRGAVTFKFTDPLVPLIAAAKGWDDEQLRTFWQFCSTLD